MSRAGNKLAAPPVKAVAGKTEGKADGKGKSVHLHVMDEPQVVRAFVEGVGRRTGLPIELKEVSYYPPVPFHQRCIGAVRAATQRLGY